MGNPEVRQTVIGDHNIFTATGDIRINYQLPPAEAEERRILLQLAENVERFWIEGVLEHSLHEAAMLELRKEPLSDAVQHPWERILELPGQLTQALGSERKIAEIFFETGRALLILGEPGAGKTVTLLELARGLIERFEADPTQAPPVVLNLSTWHEKRRHLVGWIEAELKNKYFVPVRRSRDWLANSRLCLLLDGLDEVPAESRASCVRAINEFVQNIGAPGIAVCSRRIEYTALPERLSFTAAVCLQPLTADQIDCYLESAGSRLATVRQLIRQDPPLQELARSPLMLNVISLAYQDLPAATIAEQSSKPLENRRTDLFECYVKRMLRRAGKAPDAYPVESTKRWLSWLACQMRRHSLTVFLLENIQPSWLAAPRQRWAYAISSRVYLALGWMILLWMLQTLVWPPATHQALLAALGFTLLFGTVLGTVAGVATGYRLTWMPGQAHKERYSFFAELCLHPLAMGTVLGLVGLASPFFEPVEQFVLSITPGRDALRGWQLGVYTGVSVGLLYGLLFCLKTGWCTADRDIQLSGGLRFSLKATWKGAKSGGVVGAVVGLIAAVIVVALQWEQLTQSSSVAVLMVVLPVVCILAALMVGLVVALIAAMFSLFSPTDLPRRARPGQGVILSAQSALLGGISVATCSGILIAIYLGLAGNPDNMRRAVSAAVCWGMAAAIWYGGFGVIQYLTLRFLLRRKNYVPRNYPSFLDYAARLIFLQKVGSGYIFVHRHLLDYFSHLPAQETKLESEIREASMPTRLPEPEAVQIQAQFEPATGQGVDAAKAAIRPTRVVPKERRRVIFATLAAVGTLILLPLLLLAYWFLEDYRANSARDRGDKLSAQGKFSEALAAYQLNLNIRRSLADQQKSNGGFQQDLSVCYEKVGNALAAQGDLPAALAAYRQELEIDRHLVDRNNSDAIWQHNLSVSYQKIGDVLKAQGKLPGALEAYQQSLRITQKLAQQDPSSNKWQYSVGINWWRIGHLRWDQNNLAGASEAYEQEMEIFTKLAEANPGDAGYALGCAESKLDVARAYRLLGKQQAAAQLLEQARDTLVGLQKRALVSPVQSEILDKVEKEISMLEGAID